MFETLMAQAVARADERAAERADRIAARLEEALPDDVRARADADRVRLTGRGLKRRLALDPAFRWIMAELNR